MSWPINVKHAAKITFVQSKCRTFQSIIYPADKKKCNGISRILAWGKSRVGLPPPFIAINNLNSYLYMLISGRHTHCLHVPFLFHWQIYGQQSSSTSSPRDKRKKKHPYSETGCSFARHFAILSRTDGILVGSLLRASCDSNFNLLPEQMVFHIGILWIDCNGKQSKQHYLCFKEGKSNFPLVVGLSK